MNKWCGLESAKPTKLCIVGVYKTRGKMKNLREQYENETGKKWWINPICHGEFAFASQEYQEWLERRSGLMVGWKCPECGMVMSPFQNVCVNSPHIKAITTNSTQTISERGVT